MRRMDPMVESALAPATIKAYKRELRKFHNWARAHDLIIRTGPELDGFLVEYRNAAEWHAIHGPLSKSMFETLVAAAQKLFPDARAELTNARACLKGWRVTVTPRHTAPMNRRWAHFLGLRIARRRGARRGATLVLQYHFCLRPTEALNLRGKDLIGTRDSAVPGTVGVCLGTRRRTKAKRQQVSRSSDPIAVALVDWLQSITGEEEFVCGSTSLSQYNAFIKEASLAEGLDSARWTAHSPRAGKATDMYLANEDFVRIREHGRWTVDASLRIYLDAASVLCANINRQLAAKNAMALAAEQSFLTAFYVLAHRTDASFL